MLSSSCLPADYEWQQVAEEKGEAVSRLKRHEGKQSLCIERRNRAESSERVCRVSLSTDQIMQDLLEEMCEEHQPGKTPAESDL